MQNVVLVDEVFALWALPILQTQTWSAIVTYSTKVRQNLQVTRQYEKKQKDKKSIQFYIQHLIHLSESLSWIGWWMDFWSLGSTSKHVSSRVCTVYFGSVFPRPELNERIWELMCRMQYVSQWICILKYCCGAYLHNVQENTTTPQLQTCSSPAADLITWIWNVTAQRFLHFCWELISIWDSILSSELLKNSWEKPCQEKKKSVLKWSCRMKDTDQKDVVDREAHF